MEYFMFVCPLPKLHEDLIVNTVELEHFFDLRTIKRIFLSDLLMNTVRILLSLTDNLPLWHFGRAYLNVYLFLWWMCFSLWTTFGKQYANQRHGHRRSLFIFLTPHDAHNFHKIGNVKTYVFCINFDFSVKKIGAKNYCAWRQQMDLHLCLVLQQN